MNTAIASLPRDPLGAEWERLELLCHYLSLSREGKLLGDEEIRRLQQLQVQVQHGRRGGGAWAGLLSGPLEALELDVLACVVAPEVQPRIGWAYQSLQRNGAEPYPTLALIQELLALEPVMANGLYHALRREGPLRRGRLIRVDDNLDPYQPIRPEAGVSAQLLGRDFEPPPPPGTQRVSIRASWEDLILPPDRIAMLREFLLWVEQRSTVEEQWGGIFVGGPVALFTGASGTGKTFAAAVLASELGWPLYRVDLGKLVSKYIGETEKNLNALFDAAHGRAMVLQFDEADSLFSKRGEVREARDRYANMEVSHLLTRIEAHCGPCILTTNLRKHLDTAFARRFQAVVEFPRPAAAARAALWQRLLPPRAPRRDEVDPALLGAAVHLSGGGIRNAALHAAYVAAGEGRAIGLSHVALGVWRELTKDGRDVSLVDLGPLARHLPGIS